MRVLLLAPQAARSAARRLAMAAHQGSSQEVESYVKDALGVIVLNRPRALNALTLGMVTRISHVLTEWSSPDSPVGGVLIRSNAPKAFCAGGDVKAAVQSAPGSDTLDPITFFATEYDMNLKISRLPIPFVALIDGIVMGGGVGVSIHGHFRVATERTVFAMPETSIGLFPDIGASFFLNQLPGKLGLYLGLTGARLTGVTVREAGLATHYLPSSAAPRVEAALQALGAAGQLRSFGRVAAALEELQAQAGPPPAGELAGLLPLVNLHFGLPTLPDILRSIRDAAAVATANQEGRGTAFALASREALSKASPLSLAVTFELLRRAAHASLATCLESDRAMVTHFCQGLGDFHEGVRAKLIDRDNAPVWKYGAVEQVPSEVVEACFSGGPFASSAAVAQRHVQSAAAQVEPSSRSAPSGCKL